MEHLNMTTPDGAQLNLDALYKICPSCFTESKDEEGNLKRVVDFAKLKSLLGDNAVEDAPEAYDFTWVGKRAAQREAAAPIKKTLRPCPEESVDWENTQNLYIEGDNLEVLKLLQNSYMGKVKMIYIDPPYNTGNDFVYHDDFAQLVEKYDEHNFDEDGIRYRRNTDSNGRFHSDWCSMMYARLMVARTLLKEDGVIFISIDDNEFENLKKISNECFGEANLISVLSWRRRKTQANLAKNVSQVHEYILIYAKNIESASINKVPYSKEYIDKAFSNKDNDPKGPYQTGPLARPANSSNREYTLTMPNGREITAKWSCSQATFNQYVEEGRLYIPKDGEGMPRIKIYLSELPGMIPNTWLDNIASNDDASRMIEQIFGTNAYFNYSKPIELIDYLLSLGTDKDSLIMDFFSGSASTAHSVLNKNAIDGGNRKFIMVQLPEKTEESSDAYKDGYYNICEIGKERIRRAGLKIKADKTSIDTGFRVFKCDSSNMKDVYFAPNDYSQGFLSMFEDNIKEDRTDLDLLFDCMLRWGVELSLPLSSKKVGACTIHNVNDGDLVGCFDGKITDEVIDAIAEMNPLRVIFRDSSFTEASQKMNLFELFKQKCGWTDTEVKNNVRVI